MKNLLMLSHYFYPFNHIATQRVAKMAKYLPEYGWNPIVICRKWTAENCKDFDPEMVPQFEKSSVAKAVVYERSPNQDRVQWLFSKFANPGLSLTWRLLRFDRSVEKSPPQFYYGAIAFLRTFLRFNRIDCVWATCPIPAPHAVANWIHKKFGIPWVADFRDIWDQKCFDLSDRRRSYLVKVEPRILSSSSAIVTVSEPLKEILQKRHKTPVYVIPNGFDHSDYGGKVRQNRKTFSIVYTGKIIFPSRNPTPLFRALETLISAKKVEPSEVSVSFYGTQSEHIIEKLLRNFVNLNNVVHIFPRVSFYKSIMLQKQACILLHLAHPDEKGIFTGKLFEYLGAQRPILCVPGDNDCVDALLEQTKAGIVCRNVTETAAQLLCWYKEWRRIGTVSYHGRQEETMKYSRKEQARDLAKLLEQSTNGFDQVP